MEKQLVTHEDSRLPLAQLVRERSADIGRIATAKRILVAEGLYRINGYIDAISLYIDLRQKHTVIISCVYKSLNVLTEMGLVDTKPSPDGRYMLYRAKKI